MLTFVKKKVKVDGANIETGSTINWVEAIYTNGLILDHNGQGALGYGSIDGSSFNIGLDQAIGVVWANTGLFSNMSLLDSANSIRLTWTTSNASFRYFNQNGDRDFSMQPFGTSQSLLLVRDSAQLITGVLDMDNPNAVAGYDLITNDFYNAESAFFNGEISQLGTSTTAYFRNLYTYFPSLSAYAKVSDIIDDNNTIIQAIVDNYMNGVNRKNPFDGILPGSGSDDMQFSRSDVLFRPTIAGSLGDANNGFRTAGTLQFKGSLQLNYEVRNKSDDVVQSSGSYAITGYFIKFGPKMTLMIDDNVGMPTIAQDKYVRTQYQFNDSNVNSMLTNILTSAQESMQVLINWSKGAAADEVVATAAKFTWDSPIANTFQADLEAPAITGTDWFPEFANVEVNYYRKSEFSTFS